MIVTDIDELIFPRSKRDFTTTTTKDVGVSIGNLQFVVNSKGRGSC